MATAFGKILLITGNAEFLAERTRRRALEAVREEVSDVEVSETVAGQLAAGELAALTSPSLFSTATAVVVLELENLAEAPASELIAYAASPQDDVAVIAVHGGGNKGKGTLDKLRKAAAVHEVKVQPPKYERDFAGWVRSEARDLGRSIDEAAAAFLVTAVGQNLRALAGAIDQLAVTTPPGEAITLEIVRRYFGGRAEVRGYEIADAALEGRLADALERARWAEAARVAPVLVTSAFATGLRQLAQLASAPGGMRDNELASQVGAPPFKIRALRQQLRSWEPAGLARALQAVAEADIAVKGGGAEPGYAVERMILRVSAARQRH
ncbi:DNA polymerase III subunit delta [Aeromicrobium sp. PE09-221]|uniref:DNA polymerase III subunit delta n=1 Tax=Aeromicrobium sp. PE09-221 TaxID=1898043 RepID=UPI000B3EBA19|nr:DNA polymerase III subunit delta [Aeromicrobium sp. PE09-221]OUZ07273.1 DNA polymerase III subunit delta [Aeromicrobium sp. PE09-221]